MSELEGEIGKYARQLWELQRTRIMMVNRLKALERNGFDAITQAPIVAAMESIEPTERALNKTLERLAKGHFLADWITDQRGIGLGGFARIIGVTGELTQFATVSKLWRYMGQSVDNGRAPKRQKGMRVNWNPQGRVVCHQIAESMVKVGGPWREVYDAKRAEYLARPRVGPSSCPFGHSHSGDEKELDEDTGWNRKTGNARTVQCVKTAADGSESSAHVHNAAMRYMIKMFLKELWVEWHERSGQRPHENHPFGAAPVPIRGVA